MAERDFSDGTNFHKINAGRHFSDGIAWHKINKSYVSDGTAWRLFYSSGVEWTSALALGYADHESSVSYNNDSSTIYVNVASAPENTGASVNATYTFSSPFLMRSGQTLSMNIAVSGNAYGLGTIMVNGTQVLHQTVNSDYTFASDTNISTIECRASVANEDYPGMETIHIKINITVNSDYGSFLLSSSGSSGQ